MTLGLRRRSLLSFAIILTLIGSLPVAAQQKPSPEEVLKQLFSGASMRGGRGGAGGGTWTDGGAGYIRMEPSATAERARDIVRYDTATGEKQVLVTAAELTPVAAPGAKPAPLAVVVLPWSVPIPSVV